MPLESRLSGSYNAVAVRQDLVLWRFLITAVRRETLQSFRASEHVHNQQVLPSVSKLSCASQYAGAGAAGRAGAVQAAAC